MKNIISLFAFSLLLLLQVSCDSSPQVSGPKNLVIGQPVTIHVQQGSNFVEGQFKIVDSEGGIFTPTTSLMEYSFFSGKEFSFRVPPNVATGPAKLEIGSTSGPYKIDVNLYRGFVTGDGAGNVVMYSIDNPRKVLRRGSMGIGTYQLRMLNDQSNFVAFSPTDGRIDWLSVDNSDTSTFGVVAPSLSIASDTPGVNAKPSDILALSRGLVVATDRGVGTLLVNSVGAGTEVSFGSWISQAAAFNAVDISDVISEGAGARIVVAGAVGATTESVLVVFNSVPFPTNNSTKVQISLTTDGANVTDVAIARSGAYIAAVNPDLNRLFLVEFDSRNVVPTDITGCQNPRSLQFVAGDQRLAVLCVNSKTLELFSVAGTTATPYRSLPVGSDTKKPLALYYDASGLLYISLEEGGLQVVDAGSSNPEVSSVAGFDSVIAGSFFIQP
ncbi:hypothetical protein KKD52_15145 [Myxococcota bacterium]|nr:hypothetical protein [Myxococcota bacterium]MBU1413043.1 hypothetical protein [Myxococcota bacterium]MBU1511687.1 hypothetical protein [Myxococcota bacterium]